MAAKWLEISTAKRTALFNSIPQKWRIPIDITPRDGQLDVTNFADESGFFTQNELDITSKTAAELLHKLSEAEWTSEVVTLAFCKRAAVAHQLLNCLSEIFFEDAISDARALDAHLKETGKPKGPLHGLPISLKDNFHVAGTDSTLGFTSLVNDPAIQESTLVEMLRAAGSVLYCKTNVPTAMMIAETVNNLTGRTLNPLNTSLTSGGSSGGEAALVAFMGSPLGIGSDIGGSLRIPASCTGLFTLRPSFGRFPTLRTRSGLAGQEAVQSVNGPMARNVRDMRIYCKAIIDAQPWLYDPRCLPIAWRDIPNKPKLKLGVIYHDGYVYPTPPVTRALKETVEKLKAAGHEIVDWEPTGHVEGVQLLLQMFLADGGKTVRKLLEPANEPFRPEMDRYENARELRVLEMWQIQAERTELCKQYLDRWNACEGLDAILCPTTPYSSVQHGDFKYFGYTGIFNILDYSAVSFPCGVTARQDLDIYADSDPRPLSEVCASVRDAYNPEHIDGMPVSLQLISRRLEEEKILDMTETILSAL